MWFAPAGVVLLVEACVCRAPGGACALARACVIRKLISGLNPHYVRGGRRMHI